MAFPQNDARPSGAHTHWSKLGKSVIGQVELAASCRDCEKKDSEFSWALLDLTGMRGRSIQARIRGQSGRYSGPEVGLGEVGRADSARINGPS